ncbi:hypothetical protein DL93DRAFT_2202294 [Clavulina sp. PMI_390]|nr:hypothetical protein DL93DRAFT_2202294 [Clavulina sp. PMI_390]
MLTALGPNKEVELVTWERELKANPQATRITFPGVFLPQAHDHSSLNQVSRVDHSIRRLMGFILKVDGQITSSDLPRTEFDWNDSTGDSGTIDPAHEAVPDGVSSGPSDEPPKVPSTSSASGSKAERKSSPQAPFTFPSARPVAPSISAQPNSIPSASTNLIPISFTVSDGSQENWPETYFTRGPNRHDATLPTGKPFLRIDDFAANEDRQQVRQDEAKRRRAKVERWFKKIATHLSTRIYDDPDELFPGSSFTLAGFPDGYALFEQWRPEGQNHRASDLYLCGSSTVVKFRSPEEFFEHAEWLIGGMEGSCRCQYCDREYVSRSKRKKASLGGPR